MFVGNVVIATTRFMFKFIDDIVNIHFIDWDKFNVIFGLLGCNK